MTPQLVWLLLAGLALVVAIAVEAWLRRGRSGASSAQRFGANLGKPAALGTEALDTAQFHSDMARNAPFAQTADFRARPDALQTDLRPMKDDTSYATRFHAAFGKKKDD